MTDSTNPPVEKTASAAGDRKPLTTRFDDAFCLAHELHREQHRKGTKTPYISHLIAVASLVLEAGGDEDMAIAALLHDAIEDQGEKISLEQIEARFGSRVARIVHDCTDAFTQPKPPWKQRKLDYLARVPEFADDSRLVCAADKLHNAMSVLRDVRTMGDAVFERFHGRKEGTLWYQRAIAGALTKAGPNPLTKELNRVVKELENQCGVFEA
jgi:(p)ppGpp synthase/HD superfamily hydrolase